MDRSEVCFPYLFCLKSLWVPSLNCFACGRNWFLFSCPPKLLQIVMMNSSCFALFHRMNYIFACDLLLCDAVHPTIKTWTTWSQSFPFATGISGYLKFYWNIRDCSTAWHVYSIIFCVIYYESNICLSINLHVSLL